MKRVDINGEAFEQNTMNLPVNEVYKTDDLDMFKFTKFNRNVLFTDEMLEQAKEGSVQSSLTNTWWLSTDSIDWNTLKKQEYRLNISLNRD